MMMTRLPSLCLLLLLIHGCCVARGLSTTTSSSKASLASKPPTFKKKAIIIGGGPVGLGTAITLSNPPHCMNVTLYEQSTPAAYDPTKAYLYLLNGRGQTWTQRFPDVQKLLVERGSSVGNSGGMGNLTIVPADPNVPIPPSKAISQSANTEKVMQSDSYWIPRHTMTEMLEEVIREQQANNDNGERGSVELRLGMRLVSMETVNGGDMIQVTVENTKDKSVRYQETATAPFVVGADGMNSKVRDCLADDTTKPLKTNWLNNSPKKFRVRKWTSPASDLRMKVLQFPPGFEIPNVDGTLATNSETVYAIRSVNTGPRNYVSLGLLPVKDPNMIRPTNVITRPGHDVWKLQSGQETKEWFIAAFPRLDLDNMIDDEEWDRFAKAKGTSFPKCQYCPGLEVNSPDGSAGVALVGDACHAFPPDIGQGINAGLTDLEALDRALLGQDVITGEPSDTPPATLGDALKTYEKVHSPNVAAVIRLARFGSPYQYKQPLYKDRVGRFFWTANVAFRMLLNKLSFGLIPQASILLVQNTNLTFRQVMRRADLTTAGLMACFVTLLWKILSPLFKPS